MTTKPGNEYAEWVAWVQELSSKAGWSLTETAQRAGLTHPTLTATTTHGKQPTYDTCAGLAKLFKKPLERFLRLAKLLPPRPETDLDWEEFQDIYDQTSDKGRRLMKGIARQILEDERVEAGQETTERG